MNRNKNGLFDFQGEGSDAEDDDDIDGIFVWYAALGPASSSRSLADEGSEGKDFQVVTLHHIDADASGGYTVGGLTPHTRYAFFLIPFFRNVEGRPSNSKSETTMEAG